MLTLANIMQAAAPAVLNEMNRGKEYELLPSFTVGTIDEGPIGYCAYLKHTQSSNKIPIIWSAKDEERNTSEIDRVTLVSSLLRNAVQSMDRLLKVI